MPSFFFNDPATTEIYTLSLHDALPIYGTGAIMAVPAHDERDFAFAVMHQLPIVRVLARPGETGATPVHQAETGETGCRLVNSGPFSELPAGEGFRRIVDWLEQGGKGKGTVQYRLSEIGRASCRGRG